MFLIEQYLAALRNFSKGLCGFSGSPAARLDTLSKLSATISTHKSCRDSTGFGLGMFTS